MERGVDTSQSLETSLGGKGKDHTQKGATAHLRAHTHDQNTA
jgi:hypothetical protein